MVLGCGRDWGQAEVVEVPPHLPPAAASCRHPQQIGLHTGQKALIVEGDDVTLPHGQQGGIALLEVDGAEDGLRRLGLSLVLVDDLPERHLREIGGSARGVTGWGCMASDVRQVEIIPREDALLWYSKEGVRDPPNDARKHANAEPKLFLLTLSSLWTLQKP